MRPFVESILRRTSVPALLLIAALAGCDKSNDLTGVQQPPTATPTPLPGFTISGTVHGPRGVGYWMVWTTTASQVRSTTTDPSGHFAVTNLPAGTYTLHARSSNPDDGQGTVQASVPPDAVDVDLFIRPPH
jgi:hypothetical protein